MTATVRIAALVAGALGMASCGHSDPLRDVLAQPEHSHGRVMTMEVYPFDTQPEREKDTFLLCFRPCPAPWAYEPVTVLYTENGPRYRGMDGTQSARITMWFDASCHQLRGICHPHYPYTFVEGSGASE